MIIYCNGDSFVAGDELGDDLIPDHPGYFNYDADFTVSQAWKARSHDMNHMYGKVRHQYKEEIFRLDHERAFPHKLSKLLNVSVTNKALGGSSMDRIVRTTIADLINYKNNNTDVIAVIGLTHYDRTEIPNFNDTGFVDYLGNPSHWINLSLGYRNSDLIEADAVRDYKIRYEKSYHSVLCFYKNIILLQDFCKVNNIPLFWVLPHNSDVEYQLDDIHKFATDLPALEKYAALKYEIDMTAIAKEIYHKVRCPAGHYAEIVHDEVAKRLASILQENNYV